MAPQRVVQDALIEETINKLYEKQHAEGCHPKTHTLITLKNSTQAIMISGTFSCDTDIYVEAYLPRKKLNAIGYFHLYRPDEEQRAEAEHYIDFSPVPHREWYFGRMKVDSKHRGQHIARQLIDQGLPLIKELNGVHIAHFISSYGEEIMLPAFLRRGYLRLAPKTGTTPPPGFAQHWLHAP